MGETYRAVILEGKGGLDRLVVKELPLVAPGPGQVRIRVRASGAGATDLLMRTGWYLFRPKFPFTPGYEVVGDVEALGEGTSGLQLGQRVCALTVYGGQAEVMVRDARDFVPVPDGLDDAEVVALVLNYVTAWQMIHRVAKVTAGQSVLISGASGGVGTAALELFRESGARVIAAASPAQHELVLALGADSIDGRGAPLDELVRAKLPEGVDASFDGLGGRRTKEHVRATKKGGWVVGFGLVAAKSTLATIAALKLRSMFTGRRSQFYGITQEYRRDPAAFREDLPKLFALLAARKLQPRIACVLPLLDGRRAQELLERGGVGGKIVLKA
jgi:NADPH:quinone reductase-like Zn-dependent oxidoreductase